MQEQEHTEGRAPRDEAERRERRVALAHVVLTSSLALLTALAVVVYAHETGRCEDASACTPDPDAARRDRDGEAAVVAPVDEGTHGITIDERGVVRVPQATFDRAVNSFVNGGTPCALVPAFEGGRAIGVKLFGIRPGSLLAALGFENGDIVTRVGTLEIVDPQNAFEAYQMLYEADATTVTYRRRGIAFIRAYERVR